MGSAIDIFQSQYSKTEILVKREKVRKRFLLSSKNIESGKITSVGTADLKLLFRIYDEVFFDNYYQDHFKGKLTFSLSKRMTRSAGKLMSPRNLKTLKPEEEDYDLRMGVDFFFKYNELNRDKTVNGIVSRDSLEAFQLVFEHELCHLAECHIFKESSCKKSRFKALAANFFGHLESHHMLPTAKEIAIEKFNLRPGDEVIFSYENETHKGFIQNINKRATVMVLRKDGQYKDDKGNFYAKWYVPLTALKKAD